MMGSLALNLAFLCIGDMVYRAANLEHAAASLPNLSAAALMIALLAMLGPDIVIWNIHPASFILLGAYPFGMLLLRNVHLTPMWTPRLTAQTVTDQPTTLTVGSASLPVLWLRFGMLTILMTATLILGLVRREKFGIGKIGFESFTILVLYAGAASLLIAAG